MGHAAGQSAFLAIHDQKPLWKIDYNELRSLLKAEGRVLSRTDFPTDNTPPVGSILIIGGDLRTSSTQVILALSASDPEGVIQMQFSKDDDGNSWWSWEPYATSRTVTLSSPEDPGIKTISVRFMDPETIVSEPYSDSIILENPFQVRSFLTNNKNPTSHQDEDS